MNHFSKTVFLFFLVLLLAACNSSGIKSSGSGDKSQYADEQPRESYLHSPAYLNTQIGIEYMKQKEFGLALAKLKKALDFNPHLAITHTTIAILYQEIGENSLAREHFERSISLDNNDPRLRNNYGQFLCKTGNEKESLRQFEAAANNPLYGSPQIPLVNAGVCALRVNEVEKAESYFRQALEKQSNLAPALLNMMSLSVQQGNYLQGRRYLQRYKGVAKHNAETLWMGYKIEKNLGDRDAAANYAVRLKSRFPDSKQTRMLLEEMSIR